MGAIGLSASELNLCFKLYGWSNTYWIRKDAILAGTGFQVPVDQACHQLQKLLSRIRELNNFYLLVSAEQTLCEVDLNHFQNMQHNILDDFSNRLLMRTLEEAVIQMREISAKLIVRAKDPEAFHKYSSDTRMAKGEHDKDGLPKDVVRKILLSHRTRLENKLKGMEGSSNEERNLVAFRRKNIQQAERLYIDLQQRVLGGAEKLKDRDPHQR